ncbi:MAG TPA: PaaI family thioesterase [Rugosimonospora sp.]|nr:PaaI family thioesterase [Rugosimonospora sp.]
MPFAPEWAAPDPHFRAVVEESFKRQRHMATLGARLTSVRPGLVVLEAPFDPRFTQQNGFWHAGAVASLADSANGYAAYSLAPPNTDVLAVEFKINLLAPAQGERFRAEGRVLRPGRTLTVCFAEVWAHAATDEQLVATMLSTIIVRPTGP